MKKMIILAALCLSFAQVWAARDWKIVNVKIDSVDAHTTAGGTNFIVVHYDTAGGGSEIVGNCTYDNGSKGAAAWGSTSGMNYQVQTWYSQIAAAYAQGLRVDLYIDTSCVTPPEFDGSIPKLNGVRYHVPGLPGQETP